MKATLKILVIGSLATLSTAAFAGDTADASAERAKPTLKAFSPGVPPGLKVPGIANRGAGPERVRANRIQPPARPAQMRLRDGRKPPPR